MKDQKISTTLGTIILVIIAATVAGFVLICFKSYPIKSEIVTAQISDREEKVNEIDLCTDRPMGTAIGRDIYPIDPKYKHMGFLGQVFTAYDCGEERLNMINGVDGGVYSLGSGILLKNKPSKDFLDILKSIGFKCNKDIEESDCLEWETFDNVIKIEDLMKIKPFYDSIKIDDCRNCG